MTIHHEIVIAAAPDRVYEVFLDASTFSHMTGGASAQIDASEGGAFSLFGGVISGRNLEIVAGSRLVQAWRARNWPAGHYSCVRLDFSAEGQGTRVSLDQFGYPETERDHLVGGWQKNYLTPLSQLFP
jgi:activator of HSP90 ATPase